MQRRHFLISLAGLPVLARRAGTAEDFATPTPGGSVEYRYKTTPQGDLSLTAHFPAGWKAGDRRPAILFFFGGGWRNGSITQFDNQAAYLATRGMVALRCDYRVASRQKTTPDCCVEDGKSAVRWARRNASRLGIDPGKVIGSGGSAGGHVIACAALLDPHAFSAAGEDLDVSCRPDALVLFNPALDLRGREVADAAGKDVAEQISPNARLRRGIPPTVMFFGTDDRLTEQGMEYVSRAKAAGDRAEIWTAAGQGHGFFNRPPWQNLTLRQADEFLASLGYLQGEPLITATPDEPRLVKAL